jgi:hypothetical protein
MRVRRLLLASLLVGLPLGRASAQRDSLRVNQRADTARSLRPFRPLAAPPGTARFTAPFAGADTSAARDTVRWDPSRVRWIGSMRAGDVLAGVRTGAACSQLDLWCASTFEAAYGRSAGHPSLGYILGTLIGQSLTTERSRQLRLLGGSPAPPRP